MSLLDRFRAWRHERLLDRLSRQTVLTVLTLAEERLGRHLSHDEMVSVAQRFAAWMEADRARVDQMLTDPGRTLQLFLSEVF